MRRPRVVDLFSGAGLFSYAFSKSGFEIIRAIELDAYAAGTYARNVGNHVEIADICSVRPGGRCEVIVAGPPCQGFSTLGRRDANDPRNSLSFQVAKWAAVLNPRVVVIENVAAFLNSVQWQLLRRRFLRLGYEVSAEVYNAVDFGVAQRRARSFTIASRVGMPKKLLGTYSNPVSVREAWEGLARVPNGKNHHYSPKPSELALARMKLIPPGGDKRDLIRSSRDVVPQSWLNTMNEATDVWGRMDWSSPSNTLRTCLLNPSKGRYIHPAQNRVISLREAARLQSIPDGWRFEGYPLHIARQIGNSVPPKLGRALAKSVLEVV